jgi:predicted nucleotidyltransferase
MDTETIKTILSEWATKNTFIKKLWIYGSRARNDYRPDSDLDIAIEIDGLRDETPYTSFFFDHSKWKNELQELINYKVHLAHYNPYTPEDLPPEDGNVVKSVAHSNILVYTRAGSVGVGPR